LGYGAEEAVRYAFSTVGRAMVVTTFVLVAGFGILSFSTFMGNADMAKMAVITMAFALLADFIFLPPLLIALEERVSSLVKEPHDVGNESGSAAVT
jgi:predicted RND superfamily exporter protein